MEYSLDDALRNRDALVRWVIDIHNSVNEAQGKKIYEYDEAIRLYTTKDNSTVFTVVFIALLIFLIYYILKK
tara:strand:+ start:162 stop:377 length:216 start_codon:yes stop_codon:yes gene_type:complete